MNAYKIAVVLFEDEGEAINHYRCRKMDGAFPTIPSALLAFDIFLHILSLLFSRACILTLNISFLITVMVSIVYKILKVINFFY